MHSKNKLAIAMLLFMVFLNLGLALASPSGVSIVPGVTDTKPIIPAGFIDAQGGNFTNLNLSGETQTLAWQGYYGEISGNLTLSDGFNHTMYGWNALNLSGAKIFMSRASTIDWSSIAPQNDCAVDETLTGMWSDRVNATFVKDANAEMSVGDVLISANSTCAAWTYVNSSAQSSLFQELILTDGTSTVYATFVEQNSTGFDGSKHDFQMIVPDAYDRSTSTYYFYAEFS